MDPINTLLAAIVAGSVVASKDVATQAVKDGYAALKALLVRKFGETSDVADALQKVENKPDSEARQALLKEELDSAGASQDLELVQRAQAFLTLLDLRSLRSFFWRFDNDVLIWYKKPLHHVWWRPWPACARQKASV